MESPPAGDARAGLIEALRLDVTLAGDPGRLRRALADLAPADERGILLVALGAEVGVPGLLAAGQAAEAHIRLADLCGCRADVARWVVGTWELAAGPGSGAGTGALSAGEPPPEEDLCRGTGEGGEPGEDEALPEERPGRPTALRVAVWPDGAPAIAVITLDGVFVLGEAPDAARGRWRRAATPRTPLSRDIALALEEEPGQIVWSDHDGVHARALGRGGGPGPVRLGGPRLLVSPPGGDQARYPLAALGTGAGCLEVVWTANRSDLLLARARDWAARAEESELPAACASGERLTCLDVCAETGRTAWLAALGDRSRVLAAKWDLSLPGFGRWLALSPPAVLVTVAIAVLDGVPVIVGATAAGDLLSLDARAAAAGRESWHSVDRPAPIRQAGPARSLAVGAPGPASGPGRPGWLALACGQEVWAVPVTRSGDVIDCGEPIPVWLG